MYWPLGLPRIYAASSSKALPELIVEFEDDAESRETTEGSGSLINAPNSSEEARGDDVSDAGLELKEPPTPITPMTPAVKSVEHDTHEHDTHEHDTHEQEARKVEAEKKEHDYFQNDSVQPDKEPILALRLSRSGFMFATITATTLTIWQTKVY